MYLNMHIGYTIYNVFFVKIKSMCRISPVWWTEPNSIFNILFQGIFVHRI